MNICYDKDNEQLYLRFRVIDISTPEYRVKEYCDYWDMVYSKVDWNKYVADSRYSVEYHHEGKWFPVNWVPSMRGRRIF